MIVLDTNVVSEIMKPAPDPTVRAWLNDQDAQTLFLSTVTLAELGYGIKAMPEGKRRNRLVIVLDGLLELFNGRILLFDADAARHYAHLAVAARRRGRGFPTPDGYIAAIAAARGFMVALRDTAPYEAGGIAVINPWKPSIIPTTAKFQP